jgi:hypothetical protein
VKTELFSTVIATDRGTCFIDPIPLDPAALRQLQARSPTHAITITNPNHWRASATLAEGLSLPILAHPEAQLSNHRPLCQSQITNVWPHCGSLERR